MSVINVSKSNVNVFFYSSLKWKLVLQLSHSYFSTMPLRKTQRVYCLHIPETSQILRAPPFPWGEPGFALPVVQGACSQASLMSPFLFSPKAINCHLFYIFLQATHCKGPFPISPYIPSGHHNLSLPLLHHGW